MPDLYLIIVILLFVLAISDLIVGVSNDAVNFLNSAIGSKVASRNTIMIVASLGIFVGATFSSGMMEVARKGIFNPEFFYFSDIMTIFLAVMLTDIILLDFFNTIGLPTSTTVSIVFELLGAAVVMSLIKMTSSGQSILEMGTYINSSQAILIISGIFLSVLIAFAIGAMVQFLSRLIFTFRYLEQKLWIGSIWTGFALSAMTFFLLFKGLQGAAFVTDEFLRTIEDNLLLLLATAFIFWTAFLHLMAKNGINIFRIVVLFGTFALAMAFAGNDLVNFIGVPIAGFESYLSWNQSNISPSEYNMSVLKEPVRTQTYLLVLAGLVMIVTLWFSKKARSVTDTEVNLGRQEEGYERFTPNAFIRGIVRSAINVGQISQRVLPKSVIDSTGVRFRPLSLPVADRPAFDLVRAGVNLTTASILIAFATSLKLPLSTTYVSFMVAMGTSLADRAWGRDSAVYRVAGVVNVIGGWFATAIIAFSVAGIFALLIYFFQISAIVVLITLAVVFIYRSFAYHRKKDEKKQKRLTFEQSNEMLDVEILTSRLTNRISELIKDLSDMYELTLKGIVDEDIAIITKAEDAIQSMLEKNENLEYELFQSIKRVEEKDSEGSRIILYVFDLEQDLVQSAKLIVDAGSNHLRNSLSPLKEDQINTLSEVGDEITKYLQTIAYQIVSADTVSNNEDTTGKVAILELLEVHLSAQVEGIKEEKYGARNSQLMFRILLESKDIVAVASRFVKLSRRIHQPGQKKQYYSFSKKN